MGTPPRMAAIPRPATTTRSGNNTLPMHRNTFLWVFLVTNAFLSQIIAFVFARNCFWIIVTYYNNIIAIMLVFFVFLLLFVDNDQISAYLFSKTFGLVRKDIMKKNMFSGIVEVLWYEIVFISSIEMIYNSVGYWRS
jgi:hypothetical protein